MLAAQASAHLSTPSASRWALVAHLCTDARAALKRVARARSAQACLGLSVAWMAGWFALALPFAYPVAQLPSTERLLDGIALLHGPLCLLIVWLSGRVLPYGGLSGRRLAANTLALACVVVAVLSLASLTAAGLQWIDGRSTPNWALYATGIVNIGWGLCLWAGVAVAVQALVGERRLGTMAVALLMLAAVALPWLGAEHPLLHFGPRPMPYSHLAGYGHHVPTFVVTGLHHSAFTALVLLGAWLLAPRTQGERLKERFANAKHRLASHRALVAPCALLWLGSGAWIYHTAALQSPPTFGDAAAEQLAVLPAVQPALLALELAVELYPHERRFDTNGTMLLANLGTSPIDELAFHIPPQMQIHALEVPAQPVDEDARLGLRRYAFAKPLRPVERIRVNFDMASENTTGLAANGTLLESNALLPRLALTTPQLTEMLFKVRLGTALDQVAVAPGELKRTWKENHRRYFEYQTRYPIAPHFTVHSGRYVVSKDTWRDVAVEIYHTSNHRTNVPTLLDAVKAGLRRCAMALGPYPWATFRMVEMPFAHATPGRAGITAYGEAFAFTANLANRRRTAPVFDAIARDVARQWGVATADCI